MESDAVPIQSAAEVPPRRFVGLRRARLAAFCVLFTGLSWQVCASEALDRAYFECLNGTAAAAREHDLSPPMAVDLMRRVCVDQRVAEMKDRAEMLIRKGGG